MEERQLKEKRKHKGGKRVWLLADVNMPCRPSTPTLLDRKLNKSFDAIKRLMQKQTLAYLPPMQNIQSLIRCVYQSHEKRTRQLQPFVSSQNVFYLFFFPYHHDHLLWYGYYSQTSAYVYFDASFFNLFI